MKKSAKIIILVFVLLGVLILLGQSTFIVSESEQVIITQFGKPVGEPITDAGLHFKSPFVQTTNYFEKRFLEWDGDPNQVPTKDKKFIFVDCFARWQITDPLQFFKRLTNETRAHSRLDDILDGETRNFIAQHNIEEIVRTSNRELISDSLLENSGDTLIQIFVGRDKIQEMIKKSANDKAKDLGIIILDYRIKRVNYVSEVQLQVYERMKSERYRIAEKFKSEGQGEASRINGEKEKDLKVIQSKAFKDAEEIKGKADGEAAAIYAAAYDKSPSSRELYGFIKAMETFEKTFDKQTSVIISTDSEVYKYLKSFK